MKKSIISRYSYCINVMEIKMVHNNKKIVNYIKYWKKFDTISVLYVWTSKIYIRDINI